jgi:hypothetical protein
MLSFEIPFDDWSKLDESSMSVQSIKYLKNLNKNFNNTHSNKSVSSYIHSKYSVDSVLHHIDLLNELDLDHKSNKQINRMESGFNTNKLSCIDFKLSSYNNLISDDNLSSVVPNNAFNRTPIKNLQVNQTNTNKQILRFDVDSIPIFSVDKYEKNDIKNSFDSKRSDKNSNNSSKKFSFKFLVNKYIKILNSNERNENKKVRFKDNDNILNIKEENEHSKLTLSKLSNVKRSKTINKYYNKDFCHDEQNNDEKFDTNENSQKFSNFYIILKEFIMQPIKSKSLNNIINNEDGDNKEISSSDSIQSK